MRACLFVCLVIISCAMGQRCGQYEHFELCGSSCPKTCQKPNPICIPICRSGCFCDSYRVRDEHTGNCVTPSDCPSSSSELASADTQVTCISNPATCQSNCLGSLELDPLVPKRGMFQDPICKENEEFRLCETCYRSCDNPIPSCSEHCERGCFCKEGFLRNRNGRCVKLEQCPTGHNATARNITCGLHKVFQQCQRCEKSCSERHPLCLGPCRSGCFCEEGYLKHPNGQCVKLHDCPKEVMIIGVREPSVEDCGSDEEFLSCGWCEPSCSEPAPRCPAGVCTRGCLCRPPLLRHYSGRCVHERDCLPHNCPDPSEEYVCRYGCEPRCDGRICGERPRRCSLGCHCRLGLRRHSSGRCVTMEQCSNSLQQLLNATSPRSIHSFGEFKIANRSVIKL